jgi:hypothetical protein
VTKSARQGLMQVLKSQVRRNNSPARWSKSK